LKRRAHDMKGSSKRELIYRPTTARKAPPILKTYGGR
jgi:hypothetical protein